MFHKTARASLALTLAAGLAFAQTGNPPGIPRTTPAVQFDNSPRVHELIRAGNLYLSLQDALALAMENNLDIELQRYLLPQGDSELLRTKGGGLARGLNFTLAEVPTGTGGPLSPVLTTAAAAARAPRRRGRPAEPGAAPRPRRRTRHRRQFGGDQRARAKRSGRAAGQRLH